MLVFVVVNLFLVQIVTAKDFSSNPTTVKTHENDTVLLPCYLDSTGTEETGGEPILIRWYKDDELIASSDDPANVSDPERIKIYQNGSISVFFVNSDDTGEYVCEVIRSPPWGSVTQSHAIEVLYPPSVEMTPDSEFLQVKLGEEMQISCTASGVPAPIITWRSKGNEIQLLNNRHVLRLEATDRNLSGEYECLATNGVGNPASARIQLNVLYPPIITQENTWLHTCPGLRATLDCFVESDPPAEITWYKGDTPVPLDTRVVSIPYHNKHSLVIRNVRISDFGIYKCKAVNELGESEVEIQLSGVANPGIFKQIEQKISESSQNSYTLVWEVDSYTPIIEYNLWFRPYKHYKPSTIEWTKLTIPAEHSTGPMHSKAYTLTGLQDGTVYEAKLFSRNRYGWSKPSKITKFTTEGTEIDNEEEEEQVITRIHVQENVLPIDLFQFKRRTETMYSKGTSSTSSHKFLLLPLILYIFVRH